MRGAWFRRREPPSCGVRALFAVVLSDGAGLRAVERRIDWAELGQRAGCRRQGQVRCGDDYPWAGRRELDWAEFAQSDGSVCHSAWCCPNSVQVAVGLIGRRSYNHTAFLLFGSRIPRAAARPDSSLLVRGLAIRMARRLNLAIGRRGGGWGDRWHGHALTGPREARNALAYVLMNGRKHGEVAIGLDPCASIYWSADCFADVAYRELLGQMRAARDPPVVPAKTWLLRVGWRRLGLLRMVDVPHRRR